MFSWMSCIVGVSDTARPQSVAEREGHVVSFHDLADLFEMSVKKVLLMVRQTPFRQNRAAPRHDSGNALSRPWNVAQQHSGVDREVIDPLLGLLNQRVAVDLPGEILGFATDLFEGLINRHSPDGYGRIAQNPLARLMNVVTRRKIHHRVGAPAGGPNHLL